MSISLLRHPRRETVTCATNSGEYVGVVENVQSLISRGRIFIYFQVFHVMTTDLGPNRNFIDHKIGRFRVNFFASSLTRINTNRGTCAVAENMSGLC